MVYKEGLYKTRPSDPPDCFCNKDIEVLRLLETSEPRFLLWPALGHHQIFLFLGFFFFKKKSLPWYTLKGTANASTCGVRGPLSRHLNLALIFRKRSRS